MTDIPYEDNPQGRAAKALGFLPPRTTRESNEQRKAIEGFLEREQFLADIIVGAVEGGTGYWALVSEYKHDTPENTRATLHEEDADGGLTGRGDNHYSSFPLMLTPSQVALALERIRQGGIEINEALRLNIMAAEDENNAGRIDAEDADVIAQIALFGEIVYG